ncbi:hypothetical protein BIV25_07965 [Streptomyces sp. MUSC 14]|uniref:DUF6114 domain-containing protein n=1 Tax=Streptomyces sp. MUSC 14 TaxID=1354889 RepID=UPI0008F574A9|nr:DUF6114 domain-containing protein [Streptomyces sp. MUSC 14]OIK00404.1 hypothetical protein BIV25_07965 [Streptomyces sp. MUSC 14]
MKSPTLPAEWRDALSRTRHEFRIWRDTRPFWAGLITLSAGLPIMYFPYAHLSWGSVTLALSSTAGAASLVIGVLLVVLGLLLWFQQNARLFAGVAAILMSLIALPLANFGGLLLGTLPGLIGGSLACAWTASDDTAAQPADGGPHAP